MQAAESVLCWFSPGHCHSVFVDGGSLRTFFGRGISQYMTAHTHRCDPETHPLIKVMRTDENVGEAANKETSESWFVG